MTQQLLGTCSLCGGPVMTPKFWGSPQPAPKTCQRCFAHAKEDFGPVIEMRPPPVTRYVYPTHNCQPSYTYPFVTYGNSSTSTTFATDQQVAAASDTVFTQHADLFAKLAQSGG